MNIYTAQYKYNGLDRLDVTVKGQDPLGKFFAPTWGMVTGVKSGAMTQGQYARKYMKILGALDGQVWKDLRLLALHHKGITLVCFCKPGVFCHRVLLAKALEAAGWGEYMGER